MQQNYLDGGVTDSDIYQDGDYRRNVPRFQKTNHMLVRRPLGKVKPTVYELPEDGFRYGQSNSYEGAGAGEVVGSWATTTHTGVGQVHNAQRDFVRMNKHAALHGCVTSKNVSTFRRTNDIRLGQGYQAQATRRDENQQYFPNQSTVFGKPSPASASIGALLNNTYQRRWIQDQRDLKKLSNKSAAKPVDYAYSQHTRASVGHTKVRAPPPKPVFKLARFANVKSKYLGGAVLGGVQSRALQRQQQASGGSGRPASRGSQRGTPAQAAPDFSQGMSEAMMTHQSAAAPMQEF